MSVITPAFERRHWFILKEIDKMIHHEQQNERYKLSIDADKYDVPGMIDYLCNIGYHARSEQRNDGRFLIIFW